MSSHLSGVSNPNASLSADQVRNVRKLWRAGRRTAEQIGDRFGVSEQTIIGVVHGHRYKHFLVKKVDTKNRLTKKGEKHPSAILNNKQVREIKKLIAAEVLNLQEIGDKFGVSRHAISDIKNGRSWNHLV